MHIMISTDLLTWVLISFKAVWALPVSLCRLRCCGEEAIRKLSLPLSDSIHEKLSTLSPNPNELLI